MNAKQSDGSDAAGGWGTKAPVDVRKRRSGWVIQDRCSMWRRLPVFAHGDAQLVGEGWSQRYWHSGRINRRSCACFRISYKLQQETLVIEHSFSGSCSPPYSPRSSAEPCPAFTSVWIPEPHPRAARRLITLLSIYYLEIGCWTATHRKR